MFFFLVRGTSAINVLYTTAINSPFRRRCRAAGTFAIKKAELMQSVGIMKSKNSHGDTSLDTAVRPP